MIRALRTAMLILGFALCIVAGYVLGLTQHGATIIAVVALTVAALAIVVECVERGMWS